MQTLLCQLVARIFSSNAASTFTTLVCAIAVLNHFVIPKLTVKLNIRRCHLLCADIAFTQCTCLGRLQEVEVLRRIRRGQRKMAVAPAGELAELKLWPDDLYSLAALCCE